ncbi:MAG: hypothetical protein R2698_07700 [Microthrixaceae bacterium]
MADVAGASSEVPDERAVAAWDDSGSSWDEAATAPAETGDNMSVEPSEMTDQGVNIAADDVSPHEAFGEVAAWDDSGSSWDEAATSPVETSDNMSVETSEVTPQESTDVPPEGPQQGVSAGDSDATHHTDLDATDNTPADQPPDQPDAENHTDLQPTEVPLQQESSAAGASDELEGPREVQGPAPVDFSDEASGGQTVDTVAADDPDIALVDGRYVAYVQDTEVTDEQNPGDPITPSPREEWIDRTEVADKTEATRIDTAKEWQFGTEQRERAFDGMEAAVNEVRTLTEQPVSGPSDAPGTESMPLVDQGFVAATIVAGTIAGQRRKVCSTRGRRSKSGEAGVAAPSSQDAERLRVAVCNGLRLARDPSDHRLDVLIDRLEPDDLASPGVLDLVARSAHSSTESGSATISISSVSRSTPTT